KSPLRVELPDGEAAGVSELRPAAADGVGRIGRRDRTERRECGAEEQGQRGDEEQPPHRQLLADTSREPVASSHVTTCHHGIYLSWDCCMQMRDATEACLARRLSCVHGGRIGQSFPAFSCPAPPFSGAAVVTSVLV